MIMDERYFVKLLIGYELSMIDGWDLVDFKENHSAFDYCIYGPASWSGVGKKNGYVLHVDEHSDTYWYVEKDGRVCAEGTFTDGLAELRRLTLTQLIFCDYFYRDRNEFLKLGEKEYSEKCITKWIKKHTGATRRQAEKKVTKHVNWMKQVFLALRDLNNFIIMLDSQCGGSKLERRSWAFRNVIHKVDKVTKEFGNGELNEI